MREDFAALILSHGRPDRIRTLEALKAFGYTGRYYIVVDDEDPRLSQYQDNFGDRLLVFSKEAVAANVDAGDNFPGRTSPLWARNASFELAHSVGCRYFVQLDDDYYWFGIRSKRNMGIRNLDAIFEAFVQFLTLEGVATIALAQGGDHIGGFDGRIRLKRKAMNSFFCDVEKPFDFVGRLNDDVNTYVVHGHRGELLFTLTNVQLDQKDTQSNPGGLTEAYLDFGTYVKSFYTVMYAPHCATITSMGVNHKRLHHRIDWNAAVPCILAEHHKKEPRAAHGT